MIISPSPHNFVLSTPVPWSYRTFLASTFLVTSKQPMMKRANICQTSVSRPVPLQILATVVALSYGQRTLLLNINIIYNKIILISKIIFYIIYLLLILIMILIKINN